MTHKLSSNKYTYTIEGTYDGARIVLKQTDSGKTKPFFIAGRSVQLADLRRRMDSLTDEQCQQWFSTKKGES